MARKWKRPPGRNIRDGRGVSRRRSENARNLVPRDSVRNGAVDFEVYRTRFLGHKFVSCGGPE